MLLRSAVGSASQGVFGHSPQSPRRHSGNVASTKLGLDLDVQGSVWSVPVQMMTAPNVWVTLGVFTDLNDVVLTNLVPGTVYTLRACAMAAGNQQSEWCTPVSHMST